MPEKKRREKACETMEIYAPLAHRLGMSKIKWELEDLSLRYLDPVAYKEITSNIAEKREIRERYLETIKGTITEKLNNMGIECDIQSRAKHFYSIYRKMYSQNINIDQIYDLLAVRVLVESVTDCYAVLGMVHEIFRPIPGRFKDYIAMPKKNMYQSLHTTLIGPSGVPFEVQIRTWDMHRVAEVGIAAHWTYKEGGNTGGADDKFGWIRQLIDAYKNPTESEEIVTSLKVDLFEDEVFVFTPNGDLMSLPSGSNAIDFAYAIHSQIGDKTTGVKIGGKIRPLDTKLRNGDIVEIITSKSSNGPSRDWLKIVATNTARRKINEFFKREQRDENIERGKNALERELKRSGLYDIAHQNSDIWHKAVLKKYNLPSLDDMFAMVGYGGLSVLKVMSRLKESLKKQIEEHQQKEKEKQPEPQQASQTAKKANIGAEEVIVRGIDNCLVRFAKCCNPVHGDEIKGYITRGRGVTVHHVNCVNITDTTEEQRARMIDVEWGGEAKTNYLSSIKVIVHSKPGIFASVAAVISEMKISIYSIEAREGNIKNGNTVIHLVLSIPNKETLEKVFHKLRKIPDVISAERSTN
jgi:GTP pyrophosphokinase